MLIFPSVQSFQALNKKDHKGNSTCCESPEPDDDVGYTMPARPLETNNANKLSPAYPKLSEDFEIMMQRNATATAQQHNGVRVSCPKAFPKPILSKCAPWSCHNPLRCFFSDSLINGDIT